MEFYEASVKGEPGIMEPEPGGHECQTQPHIAEYECECHTQVNMSTNTTLNTSMNSTNTSNATHKGIQV